MKKVALLVLFISLLCFSLIGQGCFPGKHQTVDGPEAVGLINQTQGYIIRESKEGPIFKIITLPDLEEQTIKTVSGDKIFYLTGPDQQGRIVYVNGILFNKINLGLTTIKGDTHDIIFSQKGDVLDLLGYDSPIALSPNGGHLAIVRNRFPGDISKNDYFIEIWDIEKKQVICEFSVSSISRMPWFPDGKKIAYCKVVNHSEIPGFDAFPTQLREQYFKERIWPKVYTIFIYDLSNNTHTFLHTGWSPVVSSNGKSVLINDFGTGHTYYSVPYLVNVDSRGSTPVDWPGRHGSVIAFIRSNTILYMGLPTTGKKVKTVVDSPIWGRKLLPSVKIADLTTGEFQTLIETIHPYDAISYGDVKK